jgi:hypothetical protein
VKHETQKIEKITYIQGVAGFFAKVLIALLCYFFVHLTPSKPSLSEESPRLNK